MSNKTANIFERIGNLVPGYDGYLNREKVRDTDYQLRLFVKRKLEDFVAKIEKVKLNNDDNVLMRIDKAQNNLRLFCVKISNQKYGYKDLFNSEKNLGEILEKVVKNDERFIQIIENLNDIEIDQFSIENLNEKLDSILNDRKDIIS